MPWSEICIEVNATMCVFGVKLQIVNINMPRKVHLITIVQYQSKIFIYLRAIWKKTYEEEGSAMKKRNLL